MEGEGERRDLSVHNLPTCCSCITTCKPAREGNFTLNRNELNVFHTSLFWAVLVLSLTCHAFSFLFRGIILGCS